MARFQEVIEYICRRHSGPRSLDPDRIGLILYLIDWRSAIERRRSVTDIVWTVEEYGPRPDRNTRLFLISAATSSPPDFSALSGARPAADDLTLSAEETEVIEFVLSAAAAKSELELQQLVYSTFPVLRQPKTAPLNLIALAAQYEREYRHAG